MMLKVFLLSASCLALGVGMLPSAGPSFPSLHRLEAQVPDTAVMNDFAATSGIVQQGLLTEYVYDGGNLYKDFFAGNDVYFAWVASASISRSSAVADNNWKMYVWKVSYDVYQSFHMQPPEVWSNILRSGATKPFFGGFSQICHVDSANETCSVDMVFTGAVYTPVDVRLASDHRVTTDYLPVYGDGYAFYDQTDDLTELGVYSVDYFDFLRNFGVDSLWLFNMLSYGYEKGASDTVADDYNGLSYDQIYNAGKTAGIEAGSPTMLNLYGLFASVLTMPFTIVSTTFDSTLFEGTAFAFNVSVFLYSVLVILLLWKILSIIFRGR